MLKLCAAQLRQVYPMTDVPSIKGDRFTGVSAMQTDDDGEPMSPPLSPTFLSCAGKRFAWIDVGGGTGENIEKMNAYFPISNFDRVYLVDITPSLCEIARKRFERLGWHNVKVLCMDASKFEVPTEDGEDMDIALITMSYSLTMIETSYCYPIIDRLSQVLAPTGIFGVADFYVSSKRSADSARQLSWFTRWFWAIWFDSDNVYLTPGRREYLEHKFKTVKTISAMNHMIKPFVRIPYYVWVGAQKAQFPSMANFSLDGNPQMQSLKNDAGQLETPDASEKLDVLSDTDILSDDEDVDAAAVTVAKKHVYHVSNDHVHGQGYRWRQHFDPALLDRFSTYLYAFAWEDPRVDLEFLDLKKSDHMFVISSGGCNVLEYAIKVGPER
ncbi:hypothetical protein HDU91_000850 [Kappamyces sp. JEL0680]|nr:hypothetical protein HDU91_000850 [Kappamyces sp. JEL0680]